MIGIKKVVVSDKVSCNNGKNWRYIVGYQVDGAPIRLFIKTPKNVFSYGVSQYDKYDWVSQYKKIWNEVESQLFEKLVTEPIKGEGKYVHGKLKTLKERIKTNFHGQYVSYNMYCNRTAVLKIDFVYKQDKKYHPQVQAEECRYTSVENQQCNMLNDDDNDDDDDDGISRCEKKAKRFLQHAMGYKTNDK